jgi:hypothetical protein
MGYQQLFLVLASVVLMSLLMLQINTNTVAGSEALQRLELEHTAIAIAQQFIEEAKSKRFDEVSSSIPPSAMPGGFNHWNSLGHGPTESYPNFDDVDDYHNLTRTVYVNGASFDPAATSGVPFTVSIQVHYVNDSNPDLAVSQRTFFKRMTVTVSSSYIPNSVAVKHVFSYYGVNL